MSSSWMRLPAVVVGSRVVLGGRFGEEPERDTHHRLDLFADAGGRLVDTAHGYADGESERVLGRWMRTRGRERIAVVDKICEPHDSRPDARPTTIHAEIDESLRRLGTDHVDVMMLHRDDRDVPVDDIAGALVAEVDRGRARCIGVSNWPWPRLRGFLDVTGAAGHPPVVSYQRSLAVPAREIWPGALAITDSQATDLSDRAVPLLAWAAQARGWFARAADSRGTTVGPFATARNLALRDLVVAIGTGHGIPATVVALAWLLRQPHVWPIVGPATDAELAESLHATRIDLTAGEMDALDRAREVDPGGERSR